MRDLIKQFASTLGAIVAAACCLGLPVVLSVLSAAGLGFLIHDAILIPLLASFVALTLWLWGATGRHGRRQPFWLGAAGGTVAVLGLYLHPVVSALGLAALVAASLWDFPTVGARADAPLRSETALGLA